MAFVLVGWESCFRGGRDRRRGGGVPDDPRALVHRGPDYDAAAQWSHGHRQARAARRARAHCSRPRQRCQRRCARYLPT